MYSIGVILYRLITGKTPESTQIAEYINQNSLHKYQPTDNVYPIPFFLRGF